LTLYDAIVDVRLTFPGGDEKLLELISQNLVYPPIAIERNIQGRVIIEFIVKQDGSIGDVKVVRSVHPDLDKEALRVIKELPPFIPAYINGKAVERNSRLPIIFKL